MHVFMEPMPLHSEINKRNMYPKGNNQNCWSILGEICSIEFNKSFPGAIANIQHTIWRWTREASFLSLTPLPAHAWSARHNCCKSHCLVDCTFLQRSLLRTVANLHLPSCRFMEVIYSWRLSSHYFIKLSWIKHKEKERILSSGCFRYKQRNDARIIFVVLYLHA